MRRIIMGAIALLSLSAIAGTRTSTDLRKWDFSRDSISWKQVDVPHDWAIYGPFDRNNDLQKVAVEQNGEKEETWKTVVRADCRM